MPDTVRDRPYNFKTVFVDFSTLAYGRSTCKLSSSPLCTVHMLPSLEVVSASSLVYICPEFYYAYYTVSQKTCEYVFDELELSVYKNFWHTYYWDYRPYRRFYFPTSPISCNRFTLGTVAT